MPGYGPGDGWVRIPPGAQNFGVEKRVTVGTSTAHQTRTLEPNRKPWILPRESFEVTDQRIIPEERC